jgi:hypothetical protein
MGNISACKIRAEFQRLERLQRASAQNLNVDVLFCSYFSGSCQYSYKDNCSNNILVSTNFGKGSGKCKDDLERIDRVL